MASNNESSEILNPPIKFLFPFEPYTIQHDFMTCLYSTLENCRLGIFESPTGTGKSLSITCGALQWLKDHECREINTLTNEINELNNKQKETENIDDWIKAQYENRILNEQKNKLQSQIDVINKQKERIDKLKTKKKEENKSKPKWLQDKIDKNKTKSETELTLEKENVDKLEEDQELILEDVDMCSSSEEEEEVIEDNKVKILFCSRTHSQLSQIVSEIMKSPHNDVRVVTLASRQSYCINENVLGLKNNSAINERCLELQKNKNSKTTKAEDGQTLKRKRVEAAQSCQFYNKTNTDKLRDEILIEIKDVEDLVKTGKSIKACPYYASRAAIMDAQFIALPYQILLHKRTRKTSGISVKNNIVIVDEAHNILDTISSIHSSEITLTQLKNVLEQLNGYQKKYSSRFSSKNYLYLTQIVFVTKRLIKIFESNENCDYKIHTAEEFVSLGEFDNINLFPLIEFSERNKLGQKLQGFAMKYLLQVNLHEREVKPESGVKAFLKQIESKNKTKPKSKTLQETIVETDIKKTENRSLMTNCFYPLMSLFERLTDKCEDGRLLVTKTSVESNSSIKYLLLNPGAHFQDIVKEARAVIVAGGTMQPMSEFSGQLFGGSLNTEISSRITEFSCGHVVPSESLCPLVVTKGSNGTPLLFNYTNRSSPNLMNAVAMALTNICSVVPGGVVVFFPSYDYEQSVYNHLQSSGTLKKIELKKTVFREPKLSSQVDAVLDHYSKCIQNNKANKTSDESNQCQLTGALMLSVVGGKLSEGLNFSDDLGRCVVVIGMPYPNKTSPELKERMAYLNKKVGGNAGDIYYENLCFKAVNQCIGRAIRHSNDYASIILFDERYARNTEKLSKWIQTSLKITQNFGQAQGLLARFFNAKKIKLI